MFRKLLLKFKSAGKSLGIPADFPENTKSAGNYFLV
jgi:hypothetical protein